MFTDTRGFIPKPFLKALFFKRIPETKKFFADICKRTFEQIAEKSSLAKKLSNLVAS